MNLSCEIFISEREFDTKDETVALMRNLGSRLSVLQAEEALAGYQVVALTDSGDFEDEDVDRELVESVTLGRLPAIYVNLTYFTGRPKIQDAELNSLFSRAGMTLALTYPSQTD
ncbi:hypothetical protein ACFT9I_26360 [Streptomyces sp. NPDC057137]|uniref:hypothetical protein n=1 Tax=Streptomyces sp. NPDC057137 TaxID=3346030 RepID=UPI0036399A62